MRAVAIILSATGLVGALFPTAAQAQQEKLVVGAILPMSGFAAPIGGQIKNGLDTATEAINKQGGVHGRQLEWVVVDDQANPSIAAAQARHLIDVNKAAVLLGMPFAPSALAVRESARPSKTLVISLSSSPPVTGPDFKFLVRPIGRDDALAGMVADYVKTKFPGKKIGAWLSNRAPQFASSFRTAAQSRGLLFSRLDEQASDSAIPDWSHDADVIVLSPGIGSNVSLQFVARNPGVPLVIASSVVGESDLAAAKASESVKVIGNPGPNFFPEAKEMIAQARSKNLQPTSYFMYGYVATQVFSALASAATNLSGEALAAAAREKEIPTAMGRLRFDGSGDLVGWRFSVWIRSGGDVAAVDVCKAPDCKDYEQCPKDCPK